MGLVSTSVRATHLVTNAAWFGEGWERWGPVQEAAIALDLVRGLVITADNRATPALTGAVLVLDAQLGEQQRGAAGLLDRPW